MAETVASLLTSIPHDWGPKLETTSSALTRTLSGPNSISFTAPCHIALVNCPQPGREVALNSDRRSRFVAPVGILATRLQVTEHLVITTDMPLAKIARLTGFANHGHMTASMRRHKFTTPSALRRTRIIR